MKVGIIADTHDNLEYLVTALEMLRAEDIKMLLHCGDICSPHMIWTMADFDVWIAQGNMDRTAGLSFTVRETWGNGRFAWLQRVTLNGYPAAIIHGDNEDVLHNLIACGEYAYVFHGHTHRRRDKTIGQTRVINPGSMGGRRPQRRSFCVLDLETDQARFVEL